MFETWIIVLKNKDEWKLRLYSDCLEMESHDAILVVE